MKKLFILNKTGSKQRLWFFKKGDLLARQIVNFNPWEAKRLSLSRFEATDALDIRDRNALLRFTDKDRARVAKHFEIIDENKP